MVYFINQDFCITEFFCFLKNDMLLNVTTRELKNVTFKSCFGDIISSECQKGFMKRYVV